MEQEQDKDFGFYGGKTRAFSAQTIIHFQTNGLISGQGL